MAQREQGKLAPCTKAEGSSSSTWMTSQSSMQVAATQAEADGHTRQLSDDAYTILECSEFTSTPAAAPQGEASSDLGPPSGLEFVELQSSAPPDSEEALKAALTSAGLEAFVDPLHNFTLDELMNQSAEELADVLLDAGMKKDDRRKFAQMLQDCVQHPTEGVSPALVDFLSRRGLIKFAQALSDFDTVEMLLVLSDTDLVALCADKGFSKGDREKFCELVQEEKDRRRAEPSLGGTLFLALRHTARSVEKFKGTSLTAMYMPFQPPTFDFEYKYQFPEGIIPRQHSCRLAVFDVDVPERFIDHSVQKELCILVIGATGAGKSTQIDSMLNYILGVKRGESFRFKLVNEAHSVTDASLQAGQAASQTDAVTAYRLPAFRNSAVRAKVTIIDTPGFGDTRGLHFDVKIVDQLRRFFRDCEGVAEHVTGLTGVCLVTQGCLARLTESQEYVWGSILGLFGNDLSENILMCFSFADGTVPEALNAVKKSNIPVAEYFEFNNSALFADPEENNNTLSKTYWEWGRDSMEKFFVRLQQMPTKSLHLTKRVLEEREKLEFSLEYLQPAIQKMLNTADNLREESKKIESLSAEVIASQNFRYKVNVPRFRKTPVYGGTYTTNCLNCNVTCHRSCKFREDSDKRDCWAMGWGGYCTQCPSQCHWSRHQNLPYLFETYQESEERTCEDLRRRYDAATHGRQMKQRILDGLKKELEDLDARTMQKILEVKNCKERLYQIAMRPNAMPSEKYLDMMIQGEKNSQKPGFEARIKSLNSLKEKSKMLAEATAEGYDPMQAYASDPAFRKHYPDRASTRK